MPRRTIVLDTTSTTYDTHASNPDTSKERERKTKERKVRTIDVLHADGANIKPSNSRVGSDSPTQRTRANTSFDEILDLAADDFYEIFKSVYQ